MVGENKEKNVKVVGFEVKGEKLERKRPHCPKCGGGFWLAEHRDRSHCGHCGYTKWKSQGPAPAAEPQEPHGKKK